MKKWKNLTNKTKYWIMQVISTLVIVLPVAIYAILNHKKLSGGQWIGLSMTGMIMLSLVLLAFMCKIKVKSGVWVVVIACIMLVLQNIGGMLGMGLLIIGLGLIINSYIINPIILKYKKGWLEDNGKTIVYSERID